MARPARDDDDDIPRQAQRSIIMPPPDPTALTTQAVEKEIRQLQSELKARFESVESRFQAMDKATQLVHEDYVRVPTIVDRAILNLRELIFGEISKMREISVERLARIDTVFDNHATAIDAALKTQQQSAADQMQIMQSEIDKLASVSQERFTRIDTQFIERDKRTDQLSLADKTAVAAALQAAKEAVGAQNTSNSIAIAKSESSTVESIRQLQTQFTNSIAALNDKLNDTKSRLDRGEGKTSVSDPAVADGIAKLGVMMADLTKSRDAAGGHSAGVSQLAGLLIGLGGLAVAAAVMFMKAGGLQ